MNTVKFATYYNATNGMKALMEAGYLRDYKDLTAIYVCQDVHHAWVVRLTEDLNEDFEKEEGVWLMERNDIDFDDVSDALTAYFNFKLDKDKFQGVVPAIQNLTPAQFILATLLADSKQGMQNWDTEQVDDQAECEDLLDDGFGLIDVLDFTDVMTQLVKA